MENMIARGKNLLLAAVMVVIASSLAAAVPSPNSMAKPRTVFLNLTGDETLTRSLRPLIVHDLEASGMAVSSTEKDADIIVSGKVTHALEKRSLEVGTIRFLITSKLGAVDETACAAVSATKEDDLFQGTLAGEPKELRQRYRTLSTARVDPESNLALSKSFGPDFAAGLTRAGFHVVESDADLNVKINLAAKMVVISEDVMHWDFEILGRGTENSDLFQGNGILSVQPFDRPPSVCADRFTDLNWLADRNVLPALATDLLRQILRYKQ
jgi:hypothetical protein